MKAKNRYLVKNYITKNNDEQYIRAEELEKLKTLGALTGGTIHDLNNILTTITGYVDIILSRDINDSLRNEIMIIKKSAEDGAEITGRIKNYIRKEEKTQKLFDVNESIEYAALITKPIWYNQAIICKKDIEVRYLRKPPVFVMGNEKELREALVNMIINSVDAIKEKGLIEISVEEKNENAVIRISDNGEGIPENIKNMIFAPFFSTKKDRGSGLGLTQVYNTVSDMNGKVYVDSQEGRGTIFTISLPAVKQYIKVEEEKVKSAVEYTPRILVIDDQLQICNVVKEMLLRVVNTEIETTIDPKDALNRIREKKFDIVVTDLSMPGMDGSVLIDHIRRINSDILIAAMSGWVGNLEGEEGSKADYRLLKPFTIEDLEMMLVKLQEHKKTLAV